MTDVSLSNTFKHLLYLGFNIEKIGHLLKPEVKLEVPTLNLC